MTPTTPAKAATAPARRRVANRGLLAKVTTHFAQHPGEQVALRDLTAEFGVNEARMKACIADAISRSKLPGLEPVVKGNVWVYKPNGSGKAAKRILEEVGEAKGGALILQDEEGHLWAAKPLEVQ